MAEGKTRFVPVVAVLPYDDYVTLVDLGERAELPADVRQMLDDLGWTHEQIMLGYCLTLCARAQRDELLRQPQGGSDGD
jgi:hypothetical protein